MGTQAALENILQAVSTCDEMDGFVGAYLEGMRLFAQNMLHNFIIYIVTLDFDVVT